MINLISIKRNSNQNANNIDIQVEQCNRNKVRKCRNKANIYSQLLFDKRYPNHVIGIEQYLQQMVLGKLTAYRGKNETESVSYHIYKNYLKEQKLPP